MASTLLSLSNAGPALAAAVTSRHESVRRSAASLQDLLSQVGPKIQLDRTSSEPNELGTTCDLINLSQTLKTCTKEPGERALLDQIQRDLAAWLPQHFMEHPGDRVPFSDFIQSASAGSFPWQEARPPAQALALLYNFSPFQDTGATVASKRLRDFNMTFDVVACSFLHKKKQDSTIERIAEPYVSSKYFLPLPASWASWEPFKAYAVRASRVAGEMHALSNYKMVYSRAMWAPSIYAGFLFKQAHPEVEWVAEFSDPLSLDVEGLPRGTVVPSDSTSAQMIDSVTRSYPDLNNLEFTVFSLAEYLAYTFADRIIFTNSNQKLTMLNHLESESLRARVERVGEVSNHPTLPRCYYGMENPNFVPDPQKLNLGYFGEFYSSRSIREVTSAIRTLPDRLSEKVHLHVFTNYIPTSEGNRRPRNFSKRQYDELVKRAYDGVGAQGIEDRVTFNASLPYLKFLATTDTLDYLIVNDAVSGEHHSINPYLPSKWSDYAGSRAHTWAFVEQGSILSSKPATVKTPVGDAHQARSTLWDLVLDKFPELAKEV